jgi:uncharacterized membrane protein YkoI
MTKRTLMVLCLAVSAVFLSACQSVTAHLEEGVRKAANAATTGLITAEEAKSIALTDAGNPSATHVRAEFDWDDGVPEYEVEFYTDAQEWEYTIHGETGAVLNKNVENKRKSPETTAPSPNTEPAKPSATAKITAEEAEDIALNHAGLSRADVIMDRTEYDPFDRVPEYEIEFRADKWEYSYEVHAETGKILSSEKDWDD